MVIRNGIMSVVLSTPNDYKIIHNSKSSHINLLLLGEYNIYNMLC